jgi:hypothetical protein
VVDLGSGLSARASFTGDAECQKNYMQTVIIVDITYCFHEPVLLSSSNSIGTGAVHLFFLYLPEMLIPSLPYAGSLHASNFEFQGMKLDTKRSAKTHYPASRP